MGLEKSADCRGIEGIERAGIRAWTCEEGAEGACGGGGLDERGAADDKRRPRVLDPVVVPSRERAEHDLTIALRKRRCGGCDVRLRDEGWPHRGAAFDQQQECNRR